MAGTMWIDKQNPKYKVLHSYLPKNQWLTAREVFDRAPRSMMKTDIDVGSLLNSMLRNQLAVRTKNSRPRRYKMLEADPS